MIPVSRPRLEERDIELVTRCLREGWVSSSGPWVEAFEERWAQYCSRRHGIAVASGTAGLELALATLELEPGDEVVMPSLTIVSCALAAVRNGGVPVLVDCDPATWCIDPAGIAGPAGTVTRPRQIDAQRRVTVAGEPASPRAAAPIRARLLPSEWRQQQHRGP